MIICNTASRTPQYVHIQVNDLFRDCDIDSDGYFDYRQLAHIMKYGNPEEDEQ